VSLDKRIAAGKDHRKPYRGAKAVDHTCRNHGTRAWCAMNRRAKVAKRKLSTDEQLRETTP
jgi:hypothetical protein